MLPTSLADWLVPMPSTVIAFKDDDFVAVLTALGVKQNTPHLWSAGDMWVIQRSGSAGKFCGLLKEQGLSFNYAEFIDGKTMSARQRGQQRYGHDGTEMHSNLFPDPEMAAVYDRFLPREDRLDDVMRFRICLVCCGQEPWDGKTENGQMYKLRQLLLS